MADTNPTGFIGLGTMGEPMALNLRKAGVELVVWNRSPGKCTRLAAAGATVVTDAREVFALCSTILMMLADGRAIDAVLARGTDSFADRVKGRRIVNLSTVEPVYSRALADAILTAGGGFVEAPVSGSRIPAETGELVAMLSGSAGDIDAIREWLAPICRQCFECGPVPGALRMKLAVNVFLITMVTGLAEAVRFAAVHDLDIRRFADIVDAGPMSSAVSRVKASKLCNNDLTKQASISDVLKNSELVMAAASAAAITLPLMQVCRSLYAQTEAMGLGEQDMVAVIRAIESASSTLQ